MWSSEEQKLHINFLELWVIWLALLHWCFFHLGLSVRMQSENVLVVAYIICQGGTRSHAAQEESDLILSWAELHILAVFTFFCMYIHGMENWQADFLRPQQLNLGEWALHLEVFAEICLWWWMPGVVLIAFRFNNKLHMLVY